MLHEILSSLNEMMKTVMDALAVMGATVGILGLLQIVSGIITVLAALASLFWSYIRIYEWWKAKKEGKNGNVRID